MTEGREDLNDPGSEGHSAAGGRLQLPSVLDLTAAGPLRDAVLERLGSPGDMTFDASDVERITTPCVQVLLAADRALEVSGGTIRLVGDEGAMQRAFADLGLLDHYNRWSNP